MNASIKVSLMTLSAEGGDRTMMVILQKRVSLLVFQNPLGNFNESKDGELSLFLKISAELPSHYLHVTCELIIEEQRHGITIQ